jgi:hypothetical protein
MDLRFECPRCGQHLSATLAQIGFTAPCPNCDSAVTVPDASTLPAPLPPPLSIPCQTTPSTRPAPSFARSSPRTPRHGIFYYVFWGTISLFVTLAVVFVGFVFLSGAGAAFLMRFFHHPATTKTATTQNVPATQNLSVMQTSPATKNLPARQNPPPTQNLPATQNLLATQNLPALNESEAEQARTLITGLHSNTNDIKGVTSYSPDPADNYKTAVYLYIEKKLTGQPSLRWQIRYYGRDWLFIRRYRLKIDKGKAVTVRATQEIARQKSGGSVWETFDEPADKHAHVLNQMLAGKTTYLRMDGTEGDKDIQLGPEQLQRMRDVLLVFRYLGGTWPAD